MKKPRLIATVGVITALLVVFFVVPLPFHVKCAVEIVPRDAQAVYTTVPGQLVDISVRHGAEVAAGQKLARIQNLDLELDVLRLEGELAEMTARIENTQYSRVEAVRQGKTIPQVSDLLETQQALEQLLAEKRLQLGRLTLTAPKAGTILPPPRRPQDRKEGQMPNWTGTPLDPQNLGATLLETDLICMVGDPARLDALLIIDQGDIDLVQLQDEVELKLDAYPSETYASRVAKINVGELEKMPVNLASQTGGQVDTQRDASGQLRPLSTSYQALAPLDTADQMQIGMRGEGKVYTGWQPLSRRVYRFLARTFHFEL